jgi:hypothetical protein
LRLNLLDEIAGKDALLLHATVVGVFAAIPFSVLLVGHSDDLANVEAEVVLMRGGVFVERLDSKRGHRRRWQEGGGG